MSPDLHPAGPGGPEDTAGPGGPENKPGPEDTPNPRTIVNSCGVLLDAAGRILFVHRRPDRHRWPDLWHIPGGEAEDDEDVDATLVRELQEELGIEVQTFEFLDTIFDEEPLSGRRAVHNIYAVRSYDGVPALTAPEEHDALEWLAPDQLEAHGVPASLQAVLAPLSGAEPDHASGASFEHVDHEDAWDRLSAHYQEFAKIPTHQVHYGAGTPTENELQLLGDIAGRSVIEVGCGGGQNTIAFKRLGAARAVGVDQSTEQLDFARALAAEEAIDVEFLKSRVEDLAPIPDASFDAAFSSYCFQFVSDIAATFQSVHRILRPGGRFAFCLDHPAYMMFGDDGLTMTKPYFQRDAEFIWPFETGYVTRMTAVYHTIEDLFTALHDAGLVVDKLLEPTFTESDTGSWSRDVDRAQRVPRTIIFAAHKPEHTT